MFQYLKPLRWYLFFNFLFSGLSNICTALLPYFTQELIRGHYQIALSGYCIAVIGYRLATTSKCDLTGNRPFSFRQI